MKVEDQVEVSALLDDMNEMTGRHELEFRAMVQRQRAERDAIGRQIHARLATQSS